MNKEWWAYLGNDKYVFRWKSKEINPAKSDDPGLESIELHQPDGRVITGFRD